jgi:hypothetical protein
MVRRRARIRVSMLLTVVALGAFSAPQSTAASGVTADLDGRSLSVAEIARFHCELIEYPRVHCFRTEEARDARVQSALRAGVTLASGYVIAWQDAGFTGSSVTLTTDVSNLGSIGWNDRITSFKSISGASGRFYEHASYLGVYYAFCCSVQVSNVGQTYNDKFSSLDLF